MVIRDYAQDDFNACVTLFCTVFNQSPWDDQWTDTLAAEFLHDLILMPKFVGKVAVHDEGGIVGLCFAQDKVWWKGHIMYIHEMCVDDTKQRQGIGTQLIQTMKEEAVQRGISNISLLTERHYAAYSFYRKLGFKEAKNTRLMYQFMGRG